MNAPTQIVVLALLAGCTTRSPSTFVTLDAGSDAATDTAPPTDALDASDASSPPIDLPVFDIQPLDTPPLPVDIGMDLPTVPDVLPDAPLDAQPDAAGMTVDQCYITDPPVALAAPGDPGPTVGVAVFVAGVTPGPGMGAAIEVQIGSGVAATDPLSSATWTWSAGTYGSDIDGSGPTGSLQFDRYTGVAPVPATPGEWAFAGRARIHGGPWTACDLVSTTPHTYDTSFEGSFTVAVAGSPLVGYCNLQNPQTLSVAAGAVSTTVVYSRVFVLGVTDVSCTDMPPNSALVGQLGYGEMGSYPSDATWTWTMGAYADHRDSTNPLIEGDCHDIEYTAAPTAPATCGMYAYGFRYRRGTGPWSYCRWAPPAVGAPTTPPWDTWVPSLSGTMTVTGCM